jgi:predicted ester cyclase
MSPIEVSQHAIDAWNRHDPEAIIAGPFMDGTPPTGRTVTYPVASFAQIEGDKIRWEHSYLDRLGVAQQLGLK